ncbi:MAG: T9SS type A sorting domain-containing protein [Rhodothermales bacterium]
MMKSLVCLILLCLFCPLAPAIAQGWQSEIVFEGVDGKLEYIADEEGNRIPDFSHAGYRGGGVTLPVYPVVMTILPVEGDNTTHIQQAIDDVSARTPDTNGIRGALLLDVGVYRVSEQLRLRTSGVVLRGSGQGTDSTSSTIIKRTGNLTESVIKIGSGRDENAWQEQSGTRTDITSAFVQVGDRAFKVANPSLYSPGDQIIITQPITEAWLEAIDGGGTDSDPSWETDEFDIAYTRRIKAIQDSLVLIDAPVFNHLDRSLAQSYVYKRDSTGQIEEVGIEHLRVEIETSGPLAEDHARSAIEFVHVANAWAQQVATLHFLYAGVDVRHSIHVTVKDSEALEPHSIIEGGKRYNFAVFKSQLILFENNLATEGRHNYVGNGEAWDSGIVFLNNISQDAYTSSEPHRHWGQGFLFDNHVEVGSSLRSLRLRLGNRGDFGTGHGWSAVHSVAWNCKMNRTSVSVEKPPTAQNYAIGCEGNITAEAGSFQQPDGYIEGSNTPGLYPSSLYLKQLADRLDLPFGVNREASDKSNLSLSVDSFPNPFQFQTTIKVELKEPGVLELEVFDVLGRRIAVLASGFHQAGVYAFPVEIKTAGSGVYFSKGTLSSGSRQQSVSYKMIKV